MPKVIEWRSVDRYRIILVFSVHVCACTLGGTLQVANFDCVSERSSEGAIESPTGKCHRLCLACCLLNNGDGW